VSDPLNSILERVLDAVKTSNEEIFAIAENSSNEVIRITQELEEIHIELSEVIKAINEQSIIENHLQNKLIKVSSDPARYPEKVQQELCKETAEAQLKLQMSEARELQLLSRKKELEQSLRQINSSIERAEKLMSHFSLSISLLDGKIENVISSNKMIEQRQDIGLRIIKAQEDERRRIAREIHDGPAQTLTNVVLRLEIAERLFDLSPQQAKIELQDLKNLVRSNLQDIRRIIFDLRPMALDDLGIIQAISQYLNNFEAAYSIQCKLHINGSERRFPQGIEISLFRLIQEGLTNVAKHSMSERAAIAFDFQEKSTVVKIIDYGKGFNVDNQLLSPGEHFGLIGMQERVDMFSGNLVIHSSLGKGTTISINIPY
jgi:two-component system sensor histidine kinase DegS